MHVYIFICIYLVKSGLPQFWIKILFVPKEESSPWRHRSVMIKSPMLFHCTAEVQWNSCGSQNYSILDDNSSESSLLLLSVYLGGFVILMGMLFVFYCMTF